MKIYTRSKRFVLGALLLPLLAYTQVTWHQEDFNSAEALNRWAYDNNTYSLTLEDGALRNDYNRTSQSWEWDNFNYTAPQPINFELDPSISFRIRSTISGNLICKLAYTSSGGTETDETLEYTLTSFDQWQDVQLIPQDADGTLLTKIYWYINWSQPGLIESGIVRMDDLTFGSRGVGIVDLAGTFNGVDAISLDWAVSGTTVADSFFIYRNATSGFNVSAENLVADIDTIGFVDMDLDLGATYYYRISVKDDEGIVTTSSEVGVQTYDPNGEILVSILSENSDPIEQYARFEVTAALENAPYSNPFNPEEIDLRASFTSPTDSVWQVFAFWDNTVSPAAWRVRFAPNEVGEWQYVLNVDHPNGTAQSEIGTFAADESDLHGWIRVSPDNPHYLMHDDGTPFYAIGAYYPWRITSEGLDDLKGHGANFFAYWHSIYDTPGRYIESMQSGLGNYDPITVRRIDEILTWAEEKDLYMNFALWSHDAFDETTWDNIHQWVHMPYQNIVEAENIYSDSLAWTYQEKLYRYMIARWGYSSNLASWEIMNEINGTDGWAMGHQDEAITWVGNVGQFLKANDPTDRMTTVAFSGGEYPYPAIWDHVDVTNVHMYESGWPNLAPSNNIRASILTYKDVTHRFWNTYEKPFIYGESGYTDIRAASGQQYWGTPEYTVAYHNQIWATWAAGLAGIPWWWEVRSSNMNLPVLEQMGVFGEIAQSIDYLSQPWEPGQTLSNDADVLVMHTDTSGFGWLRSKDGSHLSGIQFAINGLQDRGYRVRWISTWTGAPLGDSWASSTDGIFIANIPNWEYSHPDVAFTIETEVFGDTPSEVRINSIRSSLLNSALDSTIISISLWDTEDRFCGQSGASVTLEIVEGSGSFDSPTSFSIADGESSIVFRPDTANGPVVIRATSPGLASAEVDLTVSDKQVLDNFEQYSSSSDLESVWDLWSASSPIDPILITTGAGYDQQSMQLNYDLHNRAYDGIKRAVSPAAQGAQYFKLWLRPDGSNRNLRILLRDEDNAAWSVVVQMTDTAAVNLTVPFEEFTLVATGEAGLSPQTIIELNLLVELGLGGMGAGSIVIDEILYSTSETLTSMDKSMQLPDRTDLGKAYPNPFNPVTRIPFQLHQASNVSLKVYDLTGRHIETLISGNFPPGSMEIEWQASEYASGVYLIHFNASGMQATQKILLLK